MSYGNEASAGWFYTTVCVLVDIPGVKDGRRILSGESGVTSVGVASGGGDHETKVSNSSSGTDEDDEEEEDEE